MTSTVSATPGLPTEDKAGLQIKYAAELAAAIAAAYEVQLIAPAIGDLALDVAVSLAKYDPRATPERDDYHALRMRLIGAMTTDLAASGLES